jgi:hypothetical protein
MGCFPACLLLLWQARLASAGSLTSGYAVAWICEVIPMVSSMRAIAGGLSWAILCVGVMQLTSGCSSGPTKVDISGTVTKDGQPLKVSKLGAIEVKFWRQGEGERTKTKAAEADPETGKYEIKGIETGKYKVTVQQIDPMPSAKNDLLEGAFNQQNSRIVRDVESNDQVIDIDVGKEAK